MNENSNILNEEEYPPKERFTVSLRPILRCFPYLELIIICLINIPLFIIETSIFLIYSLIGEAIIGFFIIKCIVGAGTEVTINNKNHTFILQKTKGCCCCKSRPKIIDLFQIGNLYIYSNNSRDNINCILHYKNGTKENLSDYFLGCDEASLEKCQNLLRKYFLIVNINTTMDLENIIREIINNSESENNLNTYDPNLILSII